MKKSLPILVSSVLILFLIGTNIFAQIDPTAYVSHTPMPTRLIMPMVYHDENYGIENINTVMQYGAFDNYMISFSNGFAETHITVNPSNPLNFIATDNRITGYAGATYVYYTTNGGVDPWLYTTSGLSGNQGDPVFTVDGQNNIYLAVLNNGPRVFKSVNGGASWTLLGNLLTNTNADKEWIAADPTSGTYHNNVYVAYVNFASGGVVDFWRSTNSGSSWSLMVSSMGSGTPNPGPNVAVGPDGTVYCAWYAGGGANIRVSHDGGASFSSAVQASAYTTPGTYNGTSGRYYVKNYIRISGFPMMKVDQSNGTVYLVYCTNPPGPCTADIYSVHSTNQGVTWSSPVRVTDDNQGVANDKWMTDCAVDNTGKLWVYWWDSREDASNILTRAYGAYSTDGGNTFSANFPIGNQNFNPNSIEIYQGTQHYYLGDYQGMAGKSNITFPCWIGNGNNLQDYVAYLPDYGISFWKPTDAIAPGGTETNHLIFPMMGPYSGTVNMTSAVSPSPSPGTITVSFTGGSSKVLSGVRDSVTMTAVVSSNVPQQTYTITVTGAESSGPRTHNRGYSLQVVTGVQNNNQTAYEFALGQNYPNPFNPTTTIDFTLPGKSIVTLQVFDLLGREVATLINNSPRPAGFNSEVFDASKLSSGVYYYKLTAGNFSDIKKMILVK